MKDFKTNLFIVGAAKCGTTFLADYLQQHSAIKMSSVKEPNYFSHEVLENKVQYYHTADVKDTEEYQKLFDQSQPYTYYGDASVSYLPYASVAQKLYDYNPDARIVILLRNPVDRAFSHYKMDKRLGFVNESFSQILNKKSTSKYAHQYYHQYVELGLYFQQVAAYLKIFGSKQVCCVENASNMEEVIPNIMAFLSLPVEAIIQGRTNEAISFKNPLLRKIYTQPWLRKFLKSIVPSSLLGNLKKEEEVLDSKTRNRLEDFYREDQQQLKQLLRNE